MSYQAWNTVVNISKEPNEVRTFYERSCERSRNPTNARLNTQRKILATLWDLWKRRSPSGQSHLYFEVPTQPTKAVFISY